MVRYLYGGLSTSLSPNRNSNMLNKTFGPETLKNTTSQLPKSSVKFLHPQLSTVSD